MANYLLHGTVHATIYEADGLIDSEHRPESTFLTGFLEGVQNTIESIGSGSRNGNIRRYATVDLGKTRVGRTRIIENERAHPVWNESFRIYSAHSVSDLVVTIKDDDTVGATLIGRAKVRASELLSGDVVEGWRDLFKDDGKQVRGARVRISLQFFAAVDDANWSRGISSPDYKGVPYTFFPQRKGCKVTLYQDSHMLDNFMPEIFLEDDMVKEPTRCWEDVYEMINNAQHFIYITGWSVYTEIKLVRDPNRMIEGAENVTLGQLLKKKADEGVRVNLLVWDDRTSIEFLNPDGLMGTHDEETAEFFEDTNVCCVLCPRNPDDALSIIQGFTIGTMFTHHQKTLMVDSPVPGANDGRRRVLSMVGGIDLCDGRYDTQEHSLFHTLKDIHNDDFHQPNFPKSSIKKGGPREPWHDIHAQVEGAVAWDILYNFEQRWKMQAGDKLQKNLVSLLEISDMDPPSAVTDEQDPETWNVQLFRSIDGGAAELPEVPEEAAKAGLVTGKDDVLDRSIQDAYINAIRRAKEFIYIENQYFLGSAFGWDDHKDCGALNLIPMELTLKIVSKIEAGERFAVYVVVPMWPEGQPESGSVQAILDWMHRTMHMMYKLIGEALHAAGSEESPTDYLNFYCLGNREVHVEGDFQPEEIPDKDTDYSRAQDARRFMIYVHAKMMIVDDEYVIVGSANINERSMNGGRDTEIAIGAYQPHRLATENGLPHGQIHGLRMSLWFEHLGRLENSFFQPGSLECVQTVNAIAEEVWSSYIQDEPCDLPGHLLPFPIQVTREGVVTEKPGMPNFPDTKAPILGALQDSLPSILTT